MNSTDILVGCRLQHFRSALGWTLEDLACKLGLFAQELEDIEAGRRRARAQLVVRICALIGVGVGALFDDHSFETSLSDIAKRHVNGDDHLSRATAF